MCPTISTARRGAPPHHRALRIVLTLALFSLTLPWKLGGPGGLAAASGTGQLAFVSTWEGAAHIYLIGADGQGERRVTPPPGGYATPVWSPDGRRLAFARTAGGRSVVLVARADGSGARALTPLDTDAGLPAWAPDGRRLAVVIADVSRVGIAEQAIWVVEASGGTPRRVSTGYAPAWSPDGRRLAFVVARVGDAQIYVMDADGKNVRRTPGGTHLLPAWSPDGLWIQVVSTRGSDSRCG